MKHVPVFRHEDVKYFGFLREHICIRFYAFRALIFCLNVRFIDNFPFISYVCSLQFVFSVF